MYIELEKLQKFFKTDIQKLAEKTEDEIEYIKQTHFGDLLIEEVETPEKERFKLYRNLDCNGAEIEVMYSGVFNNYTYENILTINTNF